MAVSDERQIALVDRTLTYIDTKRVKLNSERSMAEIEGNSSRFGYVSQGSVDVRRVVPGGGEGESRHAEYGEWVLFPAGCRFELRNAKAAPAELILIQFHTAANALRQAGSPPFRLPRSRPWIQEFLARPAAAGLPDADLFQLQAYLYAIAAACMQATERSEAEDDFMRHVEQARRLLTEAYHTSIDMEELARLSGVSPSRFYQSFKQHTGQSPHKFLTNIRLNASLSLLARGSVSIMEVAHSVGYADELYFSRLFKKHMKLSPTEYAARANASVANLCLVFQGDFSVLGITPKVSLPRDWAERLSSYLPQVQESRPDVIFTYPVEDRIREALASIAPLEMMEWKGYPWRDRLMQISRTLGLPTVAERWLQHFDGKALNARKHVQRYLGDKPFLLVSAWGDRFRVYGRQRKKMQDLFYDEFGFTPPLAAEHIGFLDTDRVEEVAALSCDNALFLIPDTMSEADGVRLEQAWTSLRGSHRKPIVMIVRHPSPMLYNAAFHELLLDRTVNQLLHLKFNEKSI